MKVIRNVFEGESFTRLKTNVAGVFDRSPEEPDATLLREIGEFFDQGPNISSITAPTVVI